MLSLNRMLMVLTSMYLGLVEASQGQERDELVPARLASFEPSWTFGILINLQKVFDEERNLPEKRIVRIIALPESADEEVSVLLLVHETPPDDILETGNYHLELHRADKDGKVLSAPERLSINSKTGVLMWQGWKNMVLRTRYPTGVDSVLYSGSEYHSALESGREYGGWMSTISEQGKLFSMTQAARFARLWLQSRGSDTNAKEQFEMHLLDLQRKLGRVQQQ